MTTEPWTLVRDFDAIGYRVYWRKEEMRVKFEARVILGENVAEEVTADGYVKWDGCTNFDIYTGHMCTRNDLGDLGVLLTIIWDGAAALMPGEELNR